MKRYSPTVLRTVLTHPGSALDALTLPRRLARELRTDRAQLDAWYHDLLETDRLPSVLSDRWRAVSGTGLADYPSGSTIGPKNEVLYLLVRALQPMTVVETGVSYGFSTAYLLQGLEDNHAGVLHSIDLPNLDPSGYVNPDGVQDHSHVRAASETGSVIPPGLRARWKLTLGPSSAELEPLLDRVGPIELFFHDSEHSFANMSREYRLAWPHLAPGGYVASDDVDANAAFDAFCTEVDVRPFTWLGRGAVRKPPPSAPVASPRPVARPAPA